jgi:hypothetical protein
MAMNDDAIGCNPTLIPYLDEDPDILQAQSHFSEAMTEMLSEAPHLDRDCPPTSAPTGPPGRTPKSQPDMTSAYFVLPFVAFSGGGIKNRMFTRPAVEHVSPFLDPASLGSSADD